MEEQHIEFKEAVACRQILAGCISCSISAPCFDVPYIPAALVPPSKLRQKLRQNQGAEATRAPLGCEVLRLFPGRCDLKARQGTGRGPETFESLNSLLSLRV